MAKKPTYTVKVIYGENFLKYRYYSSSAKTPELAKEAVVKQFLREFPDTFAGALLTNTFVMSYDPTLKVDEEFSLVLTTPIINIIEPTPPTIIPDPVEIIIEPVDNVYANNSQQGQ